MGIQMSEMHGLERSGVDGYFAKPVHLRLLVSMIEMQRQKRSARARERSTPPATTNRQHDTACSPCGKPIRDALGARMCGVALHTEGG